MVQGWLDMKAGSVVVSLGLVRNYCGRSVLSHLGLKQEGEKPQDIHLAHSEARARKELGVEERLNLRDIL